MENFTKLTPGQQGHLTPTEALKMIIQTQFRPFTRYDWEAFAGCESETPYRGEHSDYVLVWDGDCVNVIHVNDEYGGQIFFVKELVDACF